MPIEPVLFDVYLYDTCAEAEEAARRGAPVRCTICGEHRFPCSCFPEVRDEEK